MAKARLLRRYCIRNSCIRQIGPFDHPTPSDPAVLDQLVCAALALPP